MTSTHRHDLPARLDEGFGYKDGQDLTIQNLAIDAANLRREGVELSALHRELLQSAMSDIAAILEGGIQ